MNCKHEQITYAAGGYFCDRCGEMVTVDAPAGDALAGEALGAKLIAWAADEENAEWIDDTGGTPMAICTFCGATLGWLGEPHEWHAPDCLHLRARQLQERGDE